MSLSMSLGYDRSVTSCLLCGVGGQGTVLASRVLAQAAQYEGLFARTAETIGMAQRGGCVVSHVRYGQIVHSPLIPQGQADVILGLEPGEAVRCLPYLKTSGLVVVATRAIWPSIGSGYDVEEMLAFLSNKARVIKVDPEVIAKASGSSRTLNMALMAAAVKTGTLGISLQQIKDTLAQRLPPRLLAMNLAALEAGCE